MRKAHIAVNPNFVIGPVRRRTFGSFVEHLGRCVYGGIYEPEHSTADANGFRRDVLELTKELGVSTVRYPGGNFVSGYRWEDGIGPVEDRPRRADLAWHTLDPNWVGIDEFMKWCAAAGVEPMMAVNLGTRGIQEAVDILEYSNIQGGTYWSDLRRKNGSDQPHAIDMWCLGNEMDGPWQIGHKTPKEYGRLAAETARAMRRMSPDLELVACGSSGPTMETFGEWERVVLTETYDLVDYISAHAYYAEKNGDLESFLACSIEMDRFISSIAATADAVKADLKSDKEIAISFDEWNVWYQEADPSKPPVGNDWPIAPHLLEDNYNVADAVVVGSLLISLLRHTDRVHSASLAQLVNVIAPIMTEEGGAAWKQTIFHPFAQASRSAAGQVLRVQIDSPLYETAAYGAVPLVDAVATYDEATGKLVVFAVNRSVEESVEISIDFGGLEFAAVEATTYHSEDPRWCASSSDDSSVSPKRNPDVAIEGSTARITVPPVSWNVMTLNKQA